ncbi:MAG: CinA family protein [Candidimonas sp.]|nr:MAG: CinA family protein [Candidimonas sp.]
MTNTVESVELARELGRMLLERHWMLVCAESCTGGLLSAAATDIPGASLWFERGFVTYSNAAKIQHLRVGADTLERFGAVSEETAIEMAAGALGVVAGAHLALSVTGIAGPDGATPGKPVGMVCFGFSRRADDGLATRAVTRLFEGDRQQVRAAAVRFALRTALEVIEPR